MEVVHREHGRAVESKAEKAREMLGVRCAVIYVDGTGACGGGGNAVPTEGVNGREGVAVSARWVGEEKH